jgi:hypothetical protein
MGGSELYLWLKKAVAEINESGTSAYGLSNAYLYALASVRPDSVAQQFRQAFDEIRSAYAGADPSSEIDDSLAANSMLMLDEEDLEKLADRIVALFHKVAEAEGLSAAT